MSDQWTIARRYLAPTSFWTWSDDGALEWRSGETIAFVSEIRTVLSRLSSNGLPPLNAVALLLAACRDTWPDASAEFASSCKAHLKVERTFLPDWLSLIFRELDRINRFDTDLRHSLEAKSQLAETVFEGARHRIIPQYAAEVVELLDTVPTEYSRDFTNEESSPDLESLRCLLPGLERVSPESLELRSKTGLDQEVTAPEEDLWPVEKMRRLLGSLIDDDAMGGIARLAKQLMAAINLPRPLTATHHMPAGGVSDIANRGNLDRLLISELAHDDLTLAVRVATNEALYLRRETPPQRPPRHRAVLLDSGIRMWGVPRVFALAAAMALTAKSERGSNVDTFYANRDKLEPFDITSRDGIHSHLRFLGTDAYPAAVERFLDEYAAQSTSTDAVIITCDDTIADEHFQRLLSKRERGSFFVASVARDGTFKLFGKSVAGSKQLSEVKLDLDNVLAEPMRRPQPLLDPDYDESLPLYFSFRQPPLLLSHHFDFHRAWHVDQFGVLAITRDRRLMLWESPHSGARQLTDDMFLGRVLWGSTNLMDGCAYAAIARHGAAEFCLLEVDSRSFSVRQTTVKLGAPVIRITVHQQTLFAICKSQVQAFSLPKGAQAGSIALGNPFLHRHGRYFLGARSWYALCHDGTTIRLEEIANPARPHPPYAMFDVAGVEGTVVLTHDRLIHSGDGSSREVRHGLKRHYQVDGISRNGKRILVSGRLNDEQRARQRQENAQFLVDSLTGRVRWAYGNPDESLETEIGQIANLRNLRIHFRGIYSDGKHVVLVSRNRTHLRFEVKAAALRFVPVAAQNERILWFEHCRQPRHVKYHLRIAKWSDGSKAFLDSRGLLHLKAATDHVPDLTLVLHEGETAGWSSHALLVGDQYFAGEKAKIETLHFFQESLSYFARLPG